MDNLTPTSPCAGLLPMTIAGLCLDEVDLGCLTSIAPFAGQQTVVSAAIEKSHGCGFPPPNRSFHKGAARMIWFGRDIALLAGTVPSPRLYAVAAVTDQSDAWACVTLTGKGGEDVLARLVPVDLRPRHFETGHTCRTLLGHMQASITRLADDRILILVFRSMALTLVEEVQAAMEAVATRG